MTIDELLQGSGLAEKAVRLDEHLVRMQWGSAFVIVAISGSAVVAIAPLFRAVPSGQEPAFYRKLLERYTVTIEPPNANDTRRNDGA